MAELRVRFDAKGGAMSDRNGWDTIVRLRCSLPGVMAKLFGHAERLRLDISSKRESMVQFVKMLNGEGGTISLCFDSDDLDRAGSEALQQLLNDCKIFNDAAARNRRARQGEPPRITLYPDRYMRHMGDGELDWMTVER